METDNYGSMIKDLRIQNGLTQNQVAESLGVTPVTSATQKTTAPPCLYEF